MIRRLLKNYRATIAQCILLVIIIPVVLRILMPFKTLVTWEAVEGIFTSLPVIGYFFDFFADLGTSTYTDVDFVKFVNILVEQMNKELPAVMVTAMCMQAMGSVCGKIQMTGLPIIPTVIGALIGGILSVYIFSAGYDSELAMTGMSALIIINVLIAVFLESGGFGPIRIIVRVFKCFLGISFASLTAVAIMAYLSVAVLLGDGRIADIQSAVMMVLTTGVPCLFFVMADILLFMPD